MTRNCSIVRDARRRLVNAARSGSIRFSGARLLGRVALSLISSLPLIKRIVPAIWSSIVNHGSTSTLSRGDIEISEHSFTINFIFVNFLFTLYKCKICVKFWLLENLALQISEKYERISVIFPLHFVQV